MFLDQDFTERDIFNIEQKQRANTISEEIVLKAKPEKDGSGLRALSDSINGYILQVLFCSKKKE